MFALTKSNFADFDAVMRNIRSEYCQNVVDVDVPTLYEHRKDVVEVVDLKCV